MKHGIALAAVMMGVLSRPALAAVDLNFEAPDANTLAYPIFSGTTQNITRGTGTDTDASHTKEFNTRLDPALGGPLGSACYRTQFAFSTKAVEPVIDAASALVRITDSNPERHALSAPDASGGIGVYVKYDGAAGEIAISLAVQEAPTGGGNNEIYESTVWKTVSGAGHWQHFYWPFQTEIDADPATSWARATGVGDGVYDGGDPGDRPQFEGVLVRPTATTATDHRIVLFLDDIYTGAEHTPLPVPVSETDWSTFE